jgi:hypothetical protein
VPRFCERAFRKNRENIGGGDEQEKGADKADVALRLSQTDLCNLFLDAENDNFQGALPTRNGSSFGESTRDKFRAQRENGFDPFGGWSGLRKLR